MSHQSSRPLDDNADLEWCHEAVQGVSRTFALTVDVLDEPMSSYICVGYLVCRIADTVEDADHIEPYEQARLLRIYDAVLDPDDETDVSAFRAAVDEHIPPGGERNDDWEVVADVARVTQTFEALPDDVREAVTPPARELVQGMEIFVERYAEEGGLRIQSREELEEYCYYAAGTVGNLVTNLVTRGDVTTERRRKLYDTAEQFGLLLQLVNIAKDVRVDYATEDNVYLPAEWLREEGVSQDAILDPEHSSEVTTVIERTADHARVFLDDAQRYLELVPTTDGNSRAAWGIPFLLAVGTLRELLANPEDALTARGVKISREEVFAVVAAMTSAGERSLAELRETVADEPYHVTGNE